MINNAGTPLAIAELTNVFPDEDGRGINSKTSERLFTVGLLGASFGPQNLGIAALVCGSVASICHAHPNVRIFLVDYAKEPATYQIRYGNGIATVELINIRFSKRLFLRNNIAFLLATMVCSKLIPIHKWRTRILQHNPVLKALYEMDIIGSIAGGDSFSDIYGLGRLIYIALPQILALSLKKPLVLLPQTIGPFRGRIAEFVARYILRHSSVICSRDQESKEVVTRLLQGDDRRFRFAYDMGFALEPQISDEKVPEFFGKKDDAELVVGLNVNGLLYIGGYAQNDMFGLTIDYPRLINRLIDYLVRTRRARVVLVSHVYGSGENTESDMAACRKIYENSDDDLRKRLHVIEEEHNHYEVKALIGRCDFFLGSRMHACIAALSQCVPAVGLAYSRKFLGVFKSVGMEELVVDIRERDENAVLSAVDRIWQDRLDYRAKLAATIPTVRASVLDLFGDLSTEIY